jgi:general secretion pathway protein F
VTVFRYKAVTLDGRVLEGEAEAEHPHRVISDLQAAGHFPISAEPKAPSSWFRRPISIRVARRDAPKPSEITALTRELATLLRAGVSLDSALRFAQQHTHSTRLKTMLARVEREVQGGKALSAALASDGEVFDAAYLSIVHAGEASGALEAALERIAEHREQVGAFRASVVAALVYPTILAVVGVISLFVLMTFVVPRLIPLFSDAEASLPLLSRGVFAVAGFLNGYWWVFVALLFAAILFGRRWLSVENNRVRRDVWLLRAPLLGSLLVMVETVRFARTLGMLLRNGVPLLSSLKLTKGVAQNRTIAAMVERSAVAVESGSRLTSILKRERLLPELASELIAIGEEAGKIEEMLERVAEHFEAEVRQRLKYALSLIEPVLILGLGGIIALVIVAVLMAMLGLNDLVA